MTDTSISDAVAFPQDEGTGVSDGSEDYNSAAYFSLISRYKGDGTYVGEDVTGSATLQFNDVDTTNEQVDVGGGHAYINESGKSVQSGAQTTYDTTLPVDVPYVVILPSEVVDIPLDTDTTNDVWLAVNPANQDDVFIRSGSGLNAPSVPNVKLGTVNSSSGATTRANDLADSTFAALDTDVLSGGDIANAAAGEVFESDGNGNLQATSVGIWTEDGNSPQTNTGVSSATYSLASTYEEVMAWVVATDTSGGSSRLQVQVNGDTGSNYDRITADGTSVNGNSDAGNYATLAANSRTATRIQFQERAEGIKVMNLGQSEDSNHAQGASNTSVSHPLTQFTVKGVQTYDITFEVYGRDIA